MKYKYLKLVIYDVLLLLYQKTKLNRFTQIKTCWGFGLAASFPFYMTNSFNALLKVKIMPDIICLIGGETSLYLIIDGVCEFHWGVYTL